MYYEGEIFVIKEWKLKVYKSKTLLEYMIVLQMTAL